MSTHVVADKKVLTLPRTSIREQQTVVWESQDGMSWIAKEDGVAYFYVTTKSRLDGVLQQHRAAPPVRLTGRQREVLQAVCAFHSNKEIAAQLNMGERTVKYHVTQLLRRLRCKGRGELQQRFAITKEEGR